MRRYFVLVGLLLLTVGSALAQGEFPKVETAPAFMFIRNNPNLSNQFDIQNPIVGQPPITITGANDFNCAGGGGTFAYNITSLIGIAADLGGCKYFGQTIPAPVSSNINGTGFTFLFGPRLTFRSKSPFQPFAELNFGGMRISLSCKNNPSNCTDEFGTGSRSKSAFAMTVGGGFDIVINKKLSLRPVQAEYLYTRFGNDCNLQVCTFNNNQNSFRLKSGIVINWGGSAN